MEILQDYTALLKEQLEEIDRLIDVTETNLRQLEKVQNATVIVSISNGVTQYYLKDANSSKRRYVHSDQKEMLLKIAQHDYDKKVFKKLVMQRDTLKRFLAKYNINEIISLFEDMNDGKKKLVKPIIESEKEYVQKWYESFTLDQNGFREELIFPTERGEKVRSKSEKILADLFLKYGINYVYEPKIVIATGKVVFPDFAVLDIKRRRTILWEHLGKIDSEDYAVRNLKKIDTYERNGFILGEGLIVSSESKSAPVDLKVVRKKLKTLL